MNLIVASHGMLPWQQGGMEKHTALLATHLHARGHRVCVLIPKPPGGGASLPNPWPFEVERLPFAYHLPWIWAYARYGKSVAQVIQARAPQAVLFQGFLNTVLSPEYRGRVVVHPHGLEFLHPAPTSYQALVRTLLKRMAIRSLGRADRVISLGGDLTRLIENDLGVAAPRIRVIPNAVEVPMRDPGLASPRRPGAYLWVGRLVANKGLDLLQAAFDAQAHPGLTLTVIGEGPLRPQVETWAKRDSRVTYVGGVSSADLARAYQTHEALLFTSRYEGMPTVILEAMSYGLPVLATRIGAVSELVDAQTGLLCEPNVRDLTQGLLKLQELSSLEKTRMGQNALEKVQRRFTWSTVISDFESELQTP